MLALGCALASSGPVRAQPEPAIVAVAIDTSGSVRPGVLDRTVRLALEVMEQLPPGSQVAIFSFDDESRLLLERTSDRDAVRRTLGGARSSGRFTALHDALYDASRYLAEAPASRKAILLLTDGRDENSALVLEDGLAVASANRIPVFAVGVGRIEEQELRRIAKLTDGAYATLGEASATVIAERILALDVAGPAVEPEPESTGAEPAVPPAASEGGRSGRWLAAALFAALLTAVIGGVIVLRRRGYGGGRPAPEIGGDGPATMMVRNPDTTDVPRTVLLGARPCLEIVAGPGRGQVFPLSGASAVSIGRSRACEIVLDDVSISSQHCRVRPEAGQWVLHDLSSTNGTFVNERKVERHALEAGDVLRVGETSLRFRVH